ncbi:MAG: SH3 domain-containing protein [Cyanobacteria bacterium P01_C01_bin.69]
MKITRMLLTLGSAAMLSLVAAFPALAGVGYITGQVQGSRVNVRDEPSPYAYAQHYGLVGDRVQIITGDVGTDGYYWYYIEFTSGARGWVRGDFIYEQPVYR